MGCSGAGEVKQAEIRDGEIVLTGIQFEKTKIKLASVKEIKVWAKNIFKSFNEGRTVNRKSVGEKVEALKFGIRKQMTQFSADLFGVFSLNVFH